ncbi:hypothetical protein Vafri_18043 [Volvox africanus]|uniref:Uncharacterized protein n=1 Tax=Volvox africanus TaxID=51714 RepID=A0A8J4F819_9CHLO|nr:hypothetical protein Vafri_18043 [Volvox africanus]
MDFHNSGDAVKRKSGRPAALLTSESSLAVVSGHQPDEVVGGVPPNLLPAARANNVDLTGRRCGLKLDHPRGLDLTDCHAADEQQWGLRGFDLDMLINTQQAHQKGIRDRLSIHGTAQDGPATTQYTGDLAAEPSDLHCIDGPGKISPGNRAAIGRRSPHLAGMSNMTQYTCDGGEELSAPSQDHLGASCPAGHLPYKGGVACQKRDPEPYTRGVDLHAWRSPQHSSGENTSEHGSLTDPHDEGSASAALSATTDKDTDPASFRRAESSAARFAALTTSSPQSSPVQPDHEVGVQESCASCHNGDGYPGDDDAQSFLPDDELSLLNDSGASRRLRHPPGSRPAVRGASTVINCRIVVLPRGPTSSK